MDKQIRLQITEGDIELGRPCNSLYCPMALALKRATGASTVSVAELIEWQMPSGQWYKVPNNLEGRIFMRNFDKGEPVKPFETILAPAVS